LILFVPFDSPKDKKRRKSYDNNKKLKFYPRSSCLMQWLKNTFTGLGSMEAMPKLASPYDAVCVETACCYVLAVLVLQEHGARGVDGLPEIKKRSFLRC